MGHPPAPLAGDPNGQPMPKRPNRDSRDRSVSPPPAPLSEAAQLERIRAGDEAVFGQLFKAHYRGLCEVAYSYVRSREIAEELVQSVFLRVWERRERWEPAAGIRAYLFGACRNAALDHLKHLRIVDRVTAAGTRGHDPDSAADPSQAGPDEAVQAAELTAAVQRAIGELPERCRAVAVLRWRHELTNVEVARALGISVKGVEGHVRRALAVLRERLGDFGP